jgi:hypothetical protein
LRIEAIPKKVNHFLMHVERKAEGSKLKANQIYLKFSLYIPSPFDGGGRVGVDKIDWFPLPFTLLNKEF